MPNTNRNKGHKYERQLVKEMRSKGFPDCVTSRYASRLKDDQKVDLCYTEPFNIQAKMWQRSPSYHEVLKEMPNDDNLNIIFHKRPRKGEVVVMSKEDFYKLIDKTKLD